MVCLCLAHDGSKNGVSAKTLHRILGFGSYQTAWAMLHRYRCAISNAGHDLLTGNFEVDEALFGGVRRGKRGRGAPGKVLVAVAVELLAPKGFGRCRLQVIPNAGAKTLKDFIHAHAMPGSTLYTDGLHSSPSAAGPEYIHQGTSIKGSGKDANEELPGVHRIAALVKRWLMGTHQGSFKAEHLQAYLNEFPFRFNRRKSKHRGMIFYRLIEQSVAMHPKSFQELVAHPKPKNGWEKFSRRATLRSRAKTTRALVTLEKVLRAPMPLKFDQVVPARPLRQQSTFVIEDLCSAAPMAKMIYRK